MTEFRMISITPDAVEHLLKAVGTLENNTLKHVRLSVISGGCSGFKYDWKFEDHIDDNDITIPLDDNTSLIIGTKSQKLLEGSVVDLVSADALTQEIKIINPNASNSCGCGESYS